MPEVRQPVREAERFEDSPIAWFGEMLIAKDRGDFRRAAEAQRELSRLGWTVRYSQPRTIRKGDD